MKIGETIVDGVGYGYGQYGRIHGDGFGEGVKTPDSFIGRTKPNGDGYGYGEHELTKSDSMTFIQFHEIQPEGDPSDW